MKSSKISAFLLCAAITLTASAGCSNNSSSAKDSGSGTSNSEPNTYQNPGYEDATKNVPQNQTKNPELGQNQISIGMKEEADANETVFKLNSVSDAGVQGSENKKYIYLDVEINNNSDEDYSLSSLNNFYILLDNNVEVHSSLRTYYYAINNLKNLNVSIDPFTVPANGNFSGFIRGFEIPADTESFTVGFYPTQNDERNKSTVIEVKVTPEDIQPIS